MKRLALIACSLLIATGAAAQSKNDSQSVSGSTAAVINNSKSHRNVASAIAPSMGSSVDCNGTGFGLSNGWAGISLGLPSGGNTNCDVREDAKYIFALTGSRRATKERLCDNRRNRAAFARAGEACSGDKQRVSTRAITSRTSTRGASTRASAASTVDSNKIKLAACLKRAAKDPSVGCSVYQ